MKNKQFEIAKEFNIIDKVQKLLEELLQIERVTNVDFDLCGFYDNMNQVIFLTKYDIPVSIDNYYEERKQLINNVINIANNNGLKRTEDRLEDYGEHFYFVMKCNNEWNKQL